MLHLNRNVTCVGRHNLARRFLTLVAFATVACVGGAARAGLISTINDYAGPTFEADTINNNLFVNTATDFSITGTVDGSYSPTHIVDSNEMDDSGVFTLNIDLTGSTTTTSVDPDTGLTETDYTLANTQNDFLTEQIYVGPNLTDVYVSTQNVAQTVAFSTLTVFPGITEYAFSFQQNTTTPYGNVGDTIGGLGELVFGDLVDVKTVDLDVVPEPSAALGGMVLMVLLAAGRLPRRWNARKVIS
jgi:hypothetical protein